MTDSAKARAKAFAQRCLETATDRELTRGEFITGLSLALFALRGDEATAFAQFNRGYRTLMALNGIGVGDVN